ncbi:2-oxoglutarate dehydrogenase [Paraburkholderia sp. Tr-20389]|uniref:2-oxoglutarate dehydrogenase n=1 Tax=Paraburkholderia sp. Tr-20389 TaxID=2703903 RepID=UPI00197F39EF|nr:2-oxoglutarate dehydrogenase [Paraburkholderia sp. Tr-20389]MBN3751887.1 2-oxoglutarate dehydrogenase [Paraburkholderia sp. Tr-20389]
MSRIDMLSRILVVVVVGAVTGSAYAATQAVAPVTLPKGGHGVDGPFFPASRAAAVAPTTGTQLQQQAQQRVDARMGGNSVLSNGASITKAQAQSSGLGFIARHFDQIDTAHSGRVSLNDVRQYLQQQQRQ